MSLHVLSPQHHARRHARNKKRYHPTCCQVGYKFCADKTSIGRNQNQVGRYGLVCSRFSVAAYQLSHPNLQVCPTPRQINAHTVAGIVSPVIIGFIMIVFNHAVDGIAFGMSSVSAHAPYIAPNTDLILSSA